VLTPLEIVTSSNPVDMGWVAARTHRHLFLVMGNFRLGSTGLGREVMVKVYGVAMTMSQG
jgi:hypothetical protein